MGATDCEESAGTMAALQSESAGTTKDQRTAAKKKDKERLLPADDEDSQASGGETDKTKDGGKARAVPFSQPMKLDYDDIADCPATDFADERTSKSSPALPGHAPRHPPSGADLYDDNMPLDEFRSQAEQRLSELVSRIQTRTASAKKRFQMMDLTPEERVEVAEFIYEASYREWKAEQDAGTAHFRRNGNADTSGGRGISSRTGSKNPDAGTAGSEDARVVTDLMLDAGEAEGGGPEPLASASNNSNDKKQDQDHVDFSFSRILEAFSVSQEELRAIFGTMDEQMKQDAHHDPGGVGKEDEIDAATDSKSASGNAIAKANKKKVLTSTRTTASNEDETDREQKTPVPLGDMPDDGEESTVGRKWYLEGNFAEAIACWERTLKSIAYVDSKSGYTGSRLEELRNLEYSTHLNLAQAYIKNSQYAKAVESCDKVLEERFQGYKEAAEKAEKLRAGAGTKPEDAPSDQEEQIHPFLLKALYRRAMAFKSRGAREDFSKALESLQLLLKLDPGNQAAAALYGDTWRLNKVEKRKEKQNMRRIFDSKAEIVTDYESCKRFREANFLNPDTGAEETSWGVLVSFFSWVQEESGSVWRKLKRIWGPRFEKVCGKRKKEGAGVMEEPVASSGAPEGTRDKSSKRNDSPAWRKDLLRQAREEAIWEENQQKIARKAKRA